MRLLIAVLVVILAVCPKPRAAEWESIAVGGKEISYYVVSDMKKSEPIASFNADISAKFPIAGMVRDCKFIVHIRGGENSSFGGLCTLSANGEEAPAFICNDRMVGHLSVLLSQSKVMSERSVAQFVFTNCYGG